MKNIFKYLSVVFMVILVVSCPGGPESQPTDRTPVTAANISEAHYLTTLEEVRLFIEELNVILRTGNYNAWRNSLSDELYLRYSSQEFLQEVSNQPLFRMQNRVLRTSRDYFTHVVVPARANARLDDIEFLTPNRVRAIALSSISGEERRFVLYELEKIDGSWKITGDN